VMSFVFRYSLTSFPLFLYFLAILRISPIRAVSNRAAFPRSSRPPQRVRRQKARELGLRHALSAQVRFISWHS
jgi:hypothetical protein